MMSRHHLPFGYKEDGLELELTFDRKVLDSEMVFPVVGQALIERTVLFGGDVRGVAGPDGFGLVELLVGGLGLLDLLGLFLLGLVFLILDFLDLGLVLVVLGLFLGLVVFNVLQNMSEG